MPEESRRPEGIQPYFSLPFALGIAPSKSNAWNSCGRNHVNVSSNLDKKSCQKSAIVLVMLNGIGPAQLIDIRPLFSILWQVDEDFVSTFRSLLRPGSFGD
jgi:hypothetical protein